MHINIHIHEYAYAYAYVKCANKTFETFVSGAALRTNLSPFSSFILITRPTNREATLVASNKQVSVDSQPYFVSTYLTNLTIQVLQWLRLHHHSM